MAEFSETYAYLFEAKGIGEYITDTGRLIDLIGGSDLVASLCTSRRDDVLSEVLSVTNAETLEESRRAGGAFCLPAPERDQLDRVRALWRLVVGLSCPGLSFTDTDPVDGHGDAETRDTRNSGIRALRNAYRQQPGLRENTAAMLLPMGQPVTETDRRTGRVALELLSPPGGRDAERLDGVIVAQRRRGKKIAEAAGEDRLAHLFLPEDSEGYRFPRHFETDEASRGNPAFPFLRGDRRVAIVHADISGLGQTFRNVTRCATSPEDVRKAAECIEDAIARAALSASTKALLPHAVESGETKAAHARYAGLFGPGNFEDPPAGLKIVPARPVILGGDDITIIVRADLGLAFANELLAGIERETREAFPTFASLGLPEYLTACAGIAVVGAGHPFLAANRMAKGMCDHTKVWSREHTTDEGPPESALTFGVITSTVDEPYEEWIAREQFLGFEQSADIEGEASVSRMLATHCPYVVTDSGARTSAALLEISRLLNDAEGRGKLMEAISLRPKEPAAASVLYKRFREVLGAYDSDRLKALDDALEALLGQAIEMDLALPVFNDAIELIDIGVTSVPGGQS